MKAIVICLCFMVIFAHAQNVTPRKVGEVRGKVLDAGTSAPLKSVNVFVNHTTLGVITDNEGNFIIPGIPAGKYELIISLEHYKQYRRKLIVKDERPINTTLQLTKGPVSASIAPVNNPVRNMQLQRFGRFLFGAAHAGECRILNPNVLEFITKGSALLVAASAPLEIANDYLGYNVHYTLNQFQLDSSGYALSGNAWIRPMKTEDPTQHARWIANRLSTFAGSTQHFFQAVISAKVKENGFEVYIDRSGSRRITRSPEFTNNLAHLLSPYSMNGRAKPISSNGIYKIQLPPRLEIHFPHKATGEDVYRNVFHPVSWIDATSDSLRVTADGIVLDADNILVRGSMDEVGLGATLPWDYKPTSAELEGMATLNNDGVNKPNPLLEKPYLHTDRSYYYNGEKIWFKGYMNYASRFTKDTLSQSLYVDLVNTANEVEVSDVFRIENGIATGHLQIPVKLTKGDYVINAYTSWALNFGDKFVFKKPIKLLAFQESARLPGDLNIESDSSLLLIHPDKATYHPREKITLSISAHDLNGFGSAAELSVSVTDLSQAVPGPEEHTILDDFPLGSMNRAAVASGSNPIQYGIDFKGNFVIKEKGEQGIITVFQENVPDVTGIATDSKGAFHQSLQLYDSAELFLQAKNLKGRQGTVIVDFTHPMPQAGSFPKLRLDVYASEKQSVIHSSIFARATMLDEVTIKNKRVERSSGAVVYNKGDFSLSGDWIRQNNMPDLLAAITYKIPGIRTDPLRVGWYADEPLVIVDGVVVNQVGDVDVGERIRSIPARSVDRVDVIKYSTGSVYGQRGASGVIAIYTIKGELPPAPPTTFDKSKLQLVTLKGFARPSVFESPDYKSGTIDVDIKDYRATIYWNPSLRPGAKAPAVVSFFAADLPTQYRIVVEGILNDGTPVHGEKLVTIKANR